MATLTTTTGGTNGTTGTSTTGNTYAPTLPGGISSFLNQGVTAAAQAGQTNPYAGLSHGVAGFNDGQWNTVAPNLQGIAGYAPQQVQAGNTTAYAGGTGAGGVSTQGMDLSGYMNPYTDSVIAQSDRDINRQSAIQQQQNNGQAAMSGAFGGDRAAITNTETQRNAADTMARTDSALRSQNFQQAQGQANTDLNRQLQAGTTQAQMGLQAAQGNQFAGLQGQNLKLNATGQLSNLYGQDQQTRQKMLDSQYETASNNALWPQNNASWMLSQQQKLPYGSLTSTSSNGTNSTTGNGVTTGNQVTPGPSTLGQLGGIATAGVGLLGALGSSGGGGGGAIGALGSGIGALGSGISGAYNYLTGGSSAAQAGVDALNGAGTTVDAAGNLLSSGADAASSAASGIGDAFSGAGSSLGSDAFASIFARGGRVGGIAGYAAGGSVDGDRSHWDADAYWARRNQGNSGQPASDDAPTPSMHEYVHGAPPTITPDGTYADGYAPQPAGPGMTANLGIAAAAPPPDAMPQQDDSAPEPDAAPDAPPSITMGEHSTDAGTQGDDYGMPVPPITPSSAPARAAAVAASGIGAAVPQTGTASPVSDVTSAMQGNVNQQIQGGPRPGAPGRSSVDPLWLSLIKAGGAMAASKSHFALGAAGEGIEAGASEYGQQVQQQRQNDLAKYQADALAQYRAGVVQNGSGRVANGAAANNIRADHNAATEQVAQQKMQASASAAALKAQSNHGLTGPQQMQSAIDDLRAQNPGLSLADAYQQMKGFGFKQAAADQGAERVAQGQVRTDNDTTRTGLAVTNAGNMQDYRAMQVQLKATGAEDAAAKSIINAAANTGKNVSYPDAIGQVRSTRTSIGQAPVPQTTPGQGVAGLRAAASGPAPAAAPGGSDPLAGARAAIARGAPRAAVLARLQQAGINPAGL